jgi:electron transfer flavoprotein beta subunit
LTYARKLELDGTTVRVERETDTGYQKISAPLPALVSVTKSANEPRYPSLKGIMGAKKKTIAALTLAELALDRPIGGDGAKTELIELADPPARGKARIVEAADGADGARIIVEFLKEKKLI